MMLDEITSMYRVVVMMEEGWKKERLRVEAQY